MAKPGDLIAIIGKEARRKYGIGPFRVIECLDGSGDIWFEDNLPYCDGEGNIIQSRCSLDECTTNPEESFPSY